MVREPVFTVDDYFKQREYIEQLGQAFENSLKIGKKHAVDLERLLADLTAERLGKTIVHNVDFSEIRALITVDMIGKIKNISELIDVISFKTTMPLLESTSMEDNFLISPPTIGEALIHFDEKSNNFEKRLRTASTQLSQLLDRFKSFKKNIIQAAEFLNYWFVIDYIKEVEKNPRAFSQKSLHKPINRFYEIIRSYPQKFIRLEDVGIKDLDDLYDVKIYEDRYNTILKRRQKMYHIDEYLHEKVRVDALNETLAIQLNNYSDKHDINYQFDIYCRSPFSSKHGKIFRKFLPLMMRTNINQSFDENKRLIIEKDISEVLEEFKRLKNNSRKYTDSSPFLGLSHISVCNFIVLTRQEIAKSLDLLEQPLDKDREIEPIFQELKEFIKDADELDKIQQESLTAIKNLKKFFEDKNLLNLDSKFLTKKQKILLERLTD